MNRREFLSSALLAGLVGVSVTVAGCSSSSDDNGPTAPPPGSSDVQGTATGSGHTHSGVITAAQLDAGVAVSILFSGSGHTHNLPLSAAEVAQIAGGMMVQKDFNDRHLHTYTFNG